MQDCPYILAIDQGTTGSTAMVFCFQKSNEKVTVRTLAKVTTDFPQHFPKPGWVEHDLGEVWDSVQQSVSSCLAKAESSEQGFTAAKIASIGITNQRETLCVWDKKTGKPKHNAIVWQCRRSSEICEQMRSEGLEDTYRSKTGLTLDPYFSGTKFKWLVEQGGLDPDENTLVGTVDSYLLFKLTGRAVHATDASNASRTLAFDLHKKDYCSDIMEPLHLNKELLPEVKESASLFGTTKGLGFLPDGISISGILGDQQAALFGQGCVEKGSAKCTYGTGAFLLMNAGTNCPKPPKGLLTTVAWQMTGKTQYALEGSTFIAGAAMQFLRDQFGFFSDVSLTAAMAKDVQASPEVYFVPSLTGLGAPHWQADVRGAFLGLTRGTTKEQMVRAGLEGIAFQVTELFETLRSSLRAGGQSSQQTGLQVDGGACANDVLMQFQADLLETTVLRPDILETTALGAAACAAVGSGWMKASEWSAGPAVQSKFRPGTGEVIASQKEGWQKALQAAKVFAGLNK